MLQISKTKKVIVNGLRKMKIYRNKHQIFRFLYLLKFAFKNRKEFCFSIGVDRAFNEHATFTVNLALGAA